VGRKIEEEDEGEREWRKVIRDLVRHREGIPYTRDRHFRMRGRSELLFEEAEKAGLEV
jgi:hypothetical protein